MTCKYLWRPKILSPGYSVIWNKEYRNAKEDRKDPKTWDESFQTLHPGHYKDDKAILPHWQIKKQCHFCPSVLDPLWSLIQYKTRSPTLLKSHQANIGRSGLKFWKSLTLRKLFNLFVTSYLSKQKHFCQSCGGEQGNSKKCF